MSGKLYQLDLASWAESVWSSLEEHKWAVLPSTRANGPIISLLPTVLMWTVTIAFNKSSTGLAFYDWLNANYTSFEINTWWTFAITTAVYWAGGLLFMAADLFDPLHELVKKYKVQPDKRVTWQDYKKVLWIVARNQLLVALPLSVAMAIWRPLPTGHPLPGAWTSIGTFVFCLLCEEAGFYVVHRAVHSRFLYASIHKKHHEFKAPVALASTYCTMTEHLFVSVTIIQRHFTGANDLQSNLLPIVLGVLYLNSHWSLMVSFFCQLELGTLSTHSDYNIPHLHNAL